MNTKAKMMKCPRCAGTGFYYNYGVCFRCEGAKVVPYIAPKSPKTPNVNRMPDFQLLVRNQNGWFSAESGNDEALLIERAKLYRSSHFEQKVCRNEAKIKSLAGAA